MTLSPAPHVGHSQNILKTLNIIKHFTFLKMVVVDVGDSELVI